MFRVIDSVSPAGRTRAPLAFNAHQCWAVERNNVFPRYDMLRLALRDSAPDL